MLDCVKYINLTAMSVMAVGKRSYADVSCSQIEADETWKGETLKDPQIRDPTDPQTIICYDPATGQLLGRRRAMTAPEVIETVARSRQAQREYAKTSFKKRRAILTTLLDWIVENQEIVCRVTARDSGKTST